MGRQRFSHLVIPHQISVLDLYYNLDTNRVGSWVPLLMLCIDTIYWPIYQSNIAHQYSPYFSCVWSNSEPIFGFRGSPSIGIRFNPEGVHLHPNCFEGSSHQNSLRMYRLQCFHITAKGSVLLSSLTWNALLCHTVPAACNQAAIWLWLFDRKLIWAQGISVWRKGELLCW